jgi:hypothetical protein
MKQASKLFLILVFCIFSHFSFADNMKVSRAISPADLTEPCASKFINIHMEADSEEQAGMAIVKLFWLVDPQFLKSAQASTRDPIAWGISLGENFRFYCELGSVSVATAVKQTILAMQDSKVAH